MSQRGTAPLAVMDDLQKEEIMPGRDKTCNLIVFSRKDSASLNILSHLLDYGYKEVSKNYYELGNTIIVIIDKDSLFADYIEREVEKELDVSIGSLIFASRHSSQKKIPTLTAHTPGNFGKAAHGGKDGELCFSHPEATKKALQVMNQLCPEGYSVAMEATHHGPITGVPSTFVEIGSTEENWQDERAGKVVAEAIQSLLSVHKKTKAVGIGGTHYCPKFTEVAFRTEIAVGHVLPKYAEITEEHIRKALERNSGVDLVIMDWKGTPKRSTVRTIVEDMGHEVVKAKELL
jgi:D-aminoacyl-tRNA deacylase